MTQKTFSLIALVAIALLIFMFLSLPANGIFVEPTPLATITATPETPFYPISIKVSIPATTATIPYTHNTHTVTRRELEKVQFIDSNTIAYRQWGNLYIHHLITQTTELIFDGNNITSFDWSPVRQQFVVTKDGQLLLIDRTGKIIKDLSAVLATQDKFEIPSCLKPDEYIKADSNYIQDAEWNFDENGVQFSYAVAEICYRISLWELNPDTDVLDILNISNDSWVWLNAETLVSSAYHGGGARLFSIIDVPNDKTIFTVEAQGTYPTGSPDGSRLAIATHNLRKLLVFDTTTGKQLVELDFGKRDRDEDTIISGISFSNTGRYVAVQGIKGTESKKFEPKNVLAIVDIETGTLWPLPIRSQSLPHITWLPNQEQALMFDRENNTTYLSQLSPETQQIEPLGKVTDTLAAPYNWPGDSRYLPLTDQKNYNSADYITYWGDTNAGIWFWDRQKGNLPYPVYLVTPVVQGGNSDSARSDAAVFAPVLSPDETWLVFGQQIEWTSIDTYINDTTLQSIHLPSGTHRQVTTWGSVGTQ